MLALREARTVLSAPAKPNLAWKDGKAMVPPMKAES